jgi:hypothetical protein
MDVLFGHKRHILVDHKLHRRYIQSSSNLVIFTGPHAGFFFFLNL